MEVRAELEKLKDSTTFKTAQLKELTTERSKCELLRKEWEEQKKSLQAKNTELGKEVSTLQEELKDHRMKQRDHKKESDKKDIQIHELQVALDELQSRLESQVNSITGELEKNLLGLRCHQDMLLKERSRNNRLNSELEATVQNLKRAQEKIASLQSEVTGLRSHNQDMELMVVDKIQSSNATLRSLSQTASTAKKAPPVREEVDRI